jgi:predicted DNA binding CopG/RHH family protein
MLKAAARRYRQLNTSKPVTLRINQLDLIKIRAKAKRNNIPYQTLLNAVVHDFADDKRELKIK